MRPFDLFRLAGAVLLIAILSLTTLGCSHPVLGRPALLGASVTSGAGAAVTPGQPFASTPTTRTTPTASSQRPQRDAETIAVDAAVAYSAVIAASHTTPLLLGDSGVFIDPDAALSDQVAAAAAWSPSVVIAVDWLFWPVHQSLPSDLPAKERATRRLASVEAALAELDRFTCPIVIGDVPEMKRAAGHLLREEHDPGDEVRAEANRRLAAWATARPNRFVLPVSELADAVNAGTPIEAGGFLYRNGEAQRLLQQDGLHATPEGLAVLMAAAADRLVEEGLATESDRRQDLGEIALVMEREAIAAKNRSRLGLFETVSLGALWDRYRDRMAARDDAGAAEILERMLARLESFDTDPLGEGATAISIGFGLSALDMSFGQDPKTRAVYERHWRALMSEALADAPQPWRFFLWLQYAAQLPEPLQQETADALAARREAFGPFDEPYATLVCEEAATLGDARTLARCFPEIDEAYPLALRCVRKQLGAARRGRSDGSTDLLGWRFAADELRQFLDSRAAAGLPDASDAWYGRARTDGLGELIDFAERDARLRRLSEPFNRQRQAAGPRGVVTAGAEVFAAIPAPDGPAESAAIDTGPRVDLHVARLALEDAGIGFGFAENLDGAVATIGPKPLMTVVTRAERRDDGSLRTVLGPRELPGAAACWQDLRRRPSPFAWASDGTASGQSSAPIDLAPSVDLAAFAAATRAAVEAAVRAGAPPGPASSTASAATLSATWPASVVAVGIVERAVIRVPMGLDDASRTLEWATFEFTNEPVVLLGTYEVEDGAEIANGGLRLHAVIGSGSAEKRRTGELVEMRGFRVGLAAAPAQALEDESSAKAEVRVSWRPSQ